MGFYLENMRPFTKNNGIFTFDERTVRRLLKKQLKRLGIDSQHYSTHSFRKGGAHEAALARVEDCKIKAQGRWLSDCYQRYISVSMIEAAEEITVKI